MSGNRQLVGTRRGILVVLANLAIGLILIGLFQNCGGFVGKNGFTSLAINTPSKTESVKINPYPISFSQIGVGRSSAPLAVSITNQSLENLTIESVLSDSPVFVISSSECSAPLKKDEWCTFHVTYSPVAGGASSGAVNIKTNLGSFSALANGYATTLPIPIISSSSSSVMFKDTIASKDKDAQQLILTNSGIVNVQFNSIVITGGDSSDFRIESTNCLSSVSLTPGASCQMNLEFQPLSPSLKGSTLAVVIANQTDALNILLNGTGIVDPATIIGRNDVCYDTDTCNSTGPGVHTASISRSEAEANCATNMASNPNTQITCCFNGVPYRTQNAPPTNLGRSDICLDSESCNTTGPGVHTATMFRPDAEASCNINITNNPTAKISCCFDGLVYKTKNVTTIGRSDISIGTSSCATTGPGIHTASIGRSTAEDTCATNMASNPNAEITCCFNGVSYKYQPSGTQGQSDIVFDSSTCSTTGSGVHTASISRSMAEVNCAENIARNPSKKIVCCFNGSGYRISN